MQDEADRDSIAETDSDRDRGEAKGGRGGDMETGGHEAGAERGHTGLMGSGAINLSSSRPNSVPTSQHNEAGDHDVSRTVDIYRGINQPSPLASHLSCVC